jgi:chaperonin GroEL
MGISFLKEVSQRTNDTSGDGRKTTILLYQAIINEGLKVLDPSWFKSIFKPQIKAVGVRNGINNAAKVATDYLLTISKPVKDNEEIKRIAVVSSKSEEIGDVIAKTMEKLGTNSVITVESSMVSGITSEVAQGLEMDKGYISNYMVTNKDRMEAELKDVPILVTDLKIGIIDEIVPLLESVMASGKRELLIIAEDVTGDALQTFILNKLQGGPVILCVKSPGFGARKKDYLQDIATVVGATFISSDIYSNLGNVKIEDLGSAERVTSTKDKTIIVGGKGTKEALDERISEIKKELEGLDSKHDQLKVAERLAKLTNGIAVIKIGASTETETKYIKQKIEDSINSVKASLDSGILPGGGSSLLNASKAVLEAYTAHKSEYTRDELVGFKILAKALVVPLKQIAKNAGQGDGSKVLKKVSKMNQGGGYDALNNKYVEDLVDYGIIDPTKVENLAILNSTSGAGMFLTIETVSAEEIKTPGSM